MASGARRWFIVICYIAPDGVTKIEGVIAGIWKSPRRTEIMVAGNFRFNISDPEGNHSKEDIAEAISTSILDDMTTHLLPFIK